MKKLIFFLVIVVCMTLTSCGVYDASYVYPYKSHNVIVVDRRPTYHYHHPRYYKSPIRHYNNRHHYYRK